MDSYTLINVMEDAIDSVVLSSTNGSLTQTEEGGNVHDDQ